MNSPQSLRNICALTAATLILPALAFADRDHDNDRGNDNDRGGNHEERGGRGDHIPVVPEANTAWVLLPFLGAVLFFSWRQLSRAKA